MRDTLRPSRRLGPGARRERGRARRYGGWQYMLWGRACRTRSGPRTFLVTGPEERAGSVSQGWVTVPCCVPKDGAEATAPAAPISYLHDARQPHATTPRPTASTQRQPVQPDAAIRRHALGDAEDLSWRQFVVTLDRNSVGVTTSSSPSSSEALPVRVSPCPGTPRAVTVPSMQRAAPIGPPAGRRACRACRASFSASAAS